MRTLKHLFMALLLLCSTVVSAQSIEVDGIYYNVTSSTDKTVAVTNGANSYTGDVVIPESITMSCWASYNHGDGTTSQNSYTIVAEAGDKLAFNWSVSSEGNYDWLVITLDGAEILKESGVNSGTYERTFDAAGTYTLVVAYTKDGSTSNNEDQAVVSNITVNGNAFKDTYSVTSIGSSAFRDCTGLTSIVIPGCVTSIGESAFYGCSGLTSLTIGSGVTSIGNYAFYGCTGLTSVEIPNSVTSIGESAFRDCTGLTSLTIGSSVTSIGNYAFNGCSGLTSIEIPNSVTSIGYNAFRDCSGLTSVTMGNSIETVGSCAFEGCTAIGEVHISDLSAWCKIYFSDATSSPAWYSKKLFLNGELITDLVIPDDITEIKRFAFNELSSLKSVVFHENVTTIGYSAFGTCPGLSGSVVIPNSVTTIEGNAFYGGSSISSVEIGSGVTNIGSEAFYDCNNLKTVINYSLLTFTKGAWGDYGCIAYYANRVINAPNSVVIDDFVFSSVDGNYTLALYLGDETDIVLPESCNGNNYVIGDYAFYGCSGLTGELVIPDGVTCIEDYAFKGCSGLTSLTIGNGVTSIGYEAFKACRGLTGELVIPDGVTSLGSGAFCECSGFTGLTIGSGITRINNDTFNSCLGLTGELVIPDGVTSIGYAAFSLCRGLTNLTIGSGITTLDHYAFNECYGLKEFHISDIAAWCGVSLGNNESNPLNYTSNLYLNGELVTELVIPNGVTEIKEKVFKCDNIANVTIPSSVTKIGSEAFNSVNAVFDFAAETPATLGSSIFTSNAIIVVPDASLATYKAAWSDYAAQITAKGDAYVTVDVEAQEKTSDVMTKIGQDRTVFIAKLKVNGSINSYDVIQFRDKMPLLRELDLSDATVVASDKAFYNSNCTKDNDFGSYAFHNLSKLNYVKLPKNLVAVSANLFQGCSSLREIEIPETVESIGNRAFYDCTSLTNIELPKEMTSIGYSAFYNCNSLEEIVVPAGIKSLYGDWYGVFYNCHNLKKVTLPDGLETIGYNAFRSCSALKEIKLPPTVKTIENEAFYNCNSLEEVRIPSSVLSIGESAFAGCNNLKKVYTYTVEPTSLQENTFSVSVFENATLYVPEFSFDNYYWDDGWKRFLNLAEFNEPYEYFYVNNDYILNDGTGYIEGVDGENPDADINAGGGFIVEGEQGDNETPNQSLGDVNVGSNGEGTSGSIIGDNNLHIDDLHIRINVKGGRWYFFAFPFDIAFDKIYLENGNDYVFRYYDGAERANGNGGWKEVKENHLKAARGYIFQCSANDVLVLNIEDVKFKKEDKYNELVAHVSDNMKDASWNFTGNPYLSYYDIADMDYSAPVTVWDSERKTYVAIRLGDDDYHFAPYEAFFVQKPEGQDCITFNGNEQMTHKQSNSKKEKQAAARRARGIDPERLLVNLVLGNGTSNDRTRVVFNERQSLAYEIICDATKFETAGVVQLYTIGGDNVHYAINERPADNGRVALGYTASVAGFYTIEAQRMDAEVYIKDFKTGTLHNLKDGAYSFSTDSGTYNDRFEILLNGTAPGTTGIDEVEGESDVEIYDLQGRKIENAGNGIYIINGEKVVK